MDAGEEDVILQVSGLLDGKGALNNAGVSIDGRSQEGEKRAYSNIHLAINDKSTLKSYRSTIDIKDEELNQCK